MTIEQPTITFEVDEEDDPIWLDLDELKNELEVATSAEDGEWDVRIVARRRSTVVARVPAPPLGWTALQPVEGTGSVEDPVHVRPDGLDNGLLSVAVAADGTLSLGGVEGVGRLVDGGDEGDSYNYAPPAEDHLVEDPDDVRVSVIAEGPVRGVVSIVRSYTWSPRRCPSRSRQRSSYVRASGSAACASPSRTRSPIIAFGSTSRFHGRLGSPPRKASSPSSSAPSRPRRGSVRSPCRRSPPTASSMPVEWRRCSSTRWSTSSLTGGRELALTILRSTGLISRSAHAYRESPAGPEIEIPAAQCRGPWSIGFALYPHDGTWHEADVLARARALPAPVRGRAGGGARRPDQRDRPGATR